MAAGAARAACAARTGSSTPTGIASAAATASTPSTNDRGAESLFRPTGRGKSWVMSDELTRNVGRNDRPVMGVDGKAPMASKHDGAAAYSNIVTISESPVAPGIVWAGTNDGNVQ